MAPPPARGRLRLRAGARRRRRRAIGRRRGGGRARGGEAEEVGGVEGEVRRAVRREARVGERRRGGFGREDPPRPPFDLNLAVVLAGFAFEAYTSPPVSPSCFTRSPHPHP